MELVGIISAVVTRWSADTNRLKDLLSGKGMVMDKENISSNLSHGDMCLLRIITLMEEAVTGLQRQQAEWHHKVFRECCGVCQAHKATQTELKLIICGNNEPNGPATRASWEEEVLGDKTLTMSLADESSLSTICHESVELNDLNKDLLGVGTAAVLDATKVSSDEPQAAGIMFGESSKRSNNGKRRNRHAVWLAAREGNAALVDVLVASGWSVEGPATRNPLRIAAYRGHLDVAQTLLRHGANIEADHRDIRGGTALHMAAKAGHAAMVAFLIGKGANIDAKDWRHGYTPLHMAVQNSHMDVIEVLLAKGANINAVGKWVCRTKSARPLHLAVEFGHAEVVKLLIARGADLHATNMEWKTPLALAEQLQKFNVLDVIVSALRRV